MSSLIEMVQIPAGTFLMGSSEKESNCDSEKPQHLVTVPSFALGCHLVTQAQWQTVAAFPKQNKDLDPDPSEFKGPDYPVDGVSWDDAVEFCARLAAHTGHPYRLPTEAEWEYACRAGTTTPFYFGETLHPKVVNCNHDSECCDQPSPVGSFNAPNAFGLYDMHGNVWEWCADPWHDNYEGAPTDGSVWEEDGDMNVYVIRGGSWFSDPKNCRSASRDCSNPKSRSYSIGLRVACDVYQG